MRNGSLYGSLIDIARNAAPVMLISLGMTMVLATGGVDLSVAIVAIVASVAAIMMNPVIIGVELPPDLMKFVTILISPTRRCGKSSWYR